MRRSRSGRAHLDATTELQSGPVCTRCQFLPIGRTALRLPRFGAVVAVSGCARSGRATRIHLVGCALVC